MKVVLIGTVRFSLKTLAHLIDLDADVVGVLTRRQSSFNADYADMTPLCHSNGIPVRYVDQEPHAAVLHWLTALEPDVIFCFGWSDLLGSDVIGLPRLGVIGFHPASLPQNRGRHPIIWALAMGLPQTAASFFFMDNGPPDSGDLLSQAVIDIDYQDNAATLYGKIEASALEQITAFLPLLQTGAYRRTPQDHSQANAWRKRDAEDGRIDFRMSSRAIYNLVRALTHPYVGAHLIYREAAVKVWAVAEVNSDKHNLEPGKILAVDDNGILVKCGLDAVLIKEHEFKTLPKNGEYLR